MLNINSVLKIYEKCIQNDFTGIIIELRYFNRHFKLLLLYLNFQRIVLNNISSYYASHVII